MKYPSGEDARLNDVVSLGGETGLVVVSLDTDEYAPDRPKVDWSYLKRGVLIDFPKFGLIYYEEAEPDLRLIERAGAASRGDAPV
jgi:hypothetical protein